MKEKKNVLRYLKEEAEQLVIPEGISTQQIQQKLENRKQEKVSSVRFPYEETKEETGKIAEKIEQKNKEIEQKIRYEDIEEYKIPEGIEPEQLRKKLEMVENTKEQTKKKNRNRKIRWYSYITAAACFCMFMGSFLVQRESKGFLLENSYNNDITTEGKSRMALGDKKIEKSENFQIGGGVFTENLIEESEESALQAAVKYPEITYEDIYESMFGDWEEIEKGSRKKEETAGGMLDGTVVTEAVPEAAIGGEIVEYAAAEVSGSAAINGRNENFSEKQLDEALPVKTAEYDVLERSFDEIGISNYGTTNVQTPGVEEGDVVKNDGRYLYQIIYQEEEHKFLQAIQIIDTKDVLREVARIEGFENIQEFYIWEDTLVIIENKYLKTVQTDLYTEEVFLCGAEDIGRYSRNYTEITFYNIEERNQPYQRKSFTLKGIYDSSRIAEGYFYGFIKFYAEPGSGEKDYAAYIPQIDGVRLKSSEILLPEGKEGNCYLVLVSIDMKNPMQFTETTAVVTDSDVYYVSTDNIYIADRICYEEKEGWNSNRISLLRFSYEEGKFELQAEGSVKGSLEGSFSMDEYEGKLRMVTTVDEYRVESIKDERTGEDIGNSITEERRNNALYVLNEDLEIIGEIENLAEDEQIYSARFLGENGYFVTFRQTDPLFAVDLKDPENPRILSELKISGFSEYLHFWGKDRLLGIGMEADEETGVTEGMKLSMFDISNPEEVQEIAKLPLSQYDNSEAMYNHRAVMISKEANIIGFEAEGYENERYQKDYMIFSYENDEFVQKLKVETNDKYGKFYAYRGTFIGDIFYLLCGDGSVESYDLQTGEKLEEL